MQGSTEDQKIKHVEKPNCSPTPVLRELGIAGTRTGDKMYKKSKRAWCTYYICAWSPV